MMKAYEFQADRSEVLRRQLVQMSGASAPDTIQEQGADWSRLPSGPFRIPQALRELPSGLKAALVGLILASAGAGAVALVGAPADRSMDASRIILSLSRPQQEFDKLPSPALAKLSTSLGLDPTQTRLLGHTDTRTYYGAPVGDKICIMPINGTQDDGTAGCTLLKSFESYGLRIDSPDRTESGWLTVPAGTKQALQTVRNEPGWGQQAPNFLVRNNH
jgi:hypothetical protein